MFVFFVYLCLNLEGVVEISKLHTKEHLQGVGKNIKIQNTTLQRKRVGAKSKGTLDYLHSVKSFSLVTVARAGVKPSLLHSVITDSWCKTNFYYFWNSVATEFPLGNCYCFWYRTITAFSYYCWCERLFSEFSSSWVINQLLFDNSWWSQLKTLWSLIFAKN